RASDRCRVWLAAKGLSGGRYEPGPCAPHVESVSSSTRPLQTKRSGRDEPQDSLFSPVVVVERRGDLGYALAVGDPEATSMVVNGYDPVSATTHPRDISPPDAVTMARCRNDHEQ